MHSVRSAGSAAIIGHSMSCSAFPITSHFHEDSEMRNVVLILLILLLFVMSGCSSTPVVPEQFRSQIDSSISFRDMQATPQSYRGRTVLLGGEILSAKRTQEGTEFEILQLPVTTDDPP